MNTTKTVLMAAVVAFVVSMGSSGLFSGKIATSGSLLASVVNSSGGGELRVGYIPYPPEALVKDPNTGELTGICHDLLEEAGKNLNLKVSWVEEATYATMIEGLKAGRYDVVACVWPNAERAKGADFTIPFYYSAIVAYARANEHRFTTLSRINSKDVTISTIDAEMSSFIARTAFPNAKTLSLPQGTEVSQPMLNVKTGKADITIVDTAVARDFLAQNPGSIKLVSSQPLAVFPAVFMVPKGQEGFKSMLDTALQGLIDNGTVDALIAKYKKYPDSIYPVAKPYTPPR